MYAIEDVGYRLIDGYVFSAANTSAWGYGNEVQVGNAIKACKTPRSEIFVTVSLPRIPKLMIKTKLFGTYHTRVAEGIADSLHKLGLEYVDRMSLGLLFIKVYLMHWPLPLPPSDPKDVIPLLPNGDRHVLDEEEWSYIDTWKEMEKLVEKGLVKAIGVSNMSIPFLKRLMTECKIVPAVNQVYPPYLR